MESKRQQKLGRQIQKDLATIFTKEASNLFGGKFISPTEVRLTPDLGIARVYLSLMLEKDQKAVIELITEHKSQIRKILGNMIRNQVRKVPDLEFFYDDTQEYAAKIDKVMTDLDIPEDDGTDLSDTYDLDKDD